MTEMISKADAAAAVALVVERAAEAIEAIPRRKEPKGGQMTSYVDLAEATLAIRALASVDGLAEVAKLRAERDEAKRLMEMRHREMLAADELMRKHQLRADSGRAYPWPALDEAEALVNAALASPPAPQKENRNE